MSSERDLSNHPQNALAPVYRKLDRLEKTMTTINDIAAEANRSIRQGRYEELDRHQNRLTELARQFAPGRADAPA